MSRARATLVSDGSPEAAALASWLRGTVDGISVIDALGPRDVAVVARALREHEAARRLVLLARESPIPGDVDARPALEVVRDWLREVPPIDARASGARRIGEALAASATGAESVRTLARRLAPVKPSSIAAPTKRGRPKGKKNPMRGVGFDVCVTMLREPSTSFTERDLAERVGRSQYGVHRVLVELDERGFLVRTTGGTSLASPERVHGALVEAWRVRVGEPRVAQHFIAPPGATATTARDALRARGIEPIRAGATALTDDRRILDALPTYYAPDDAADALLAAGYRATRGARASLRLWPILERAVVDRPVLVHGEFATHRVVTSLDLAVSDDARERALAEEIGIP